MSDLRGCGEYQTGSQTPKDPGGEDERGGVGERQVRQYPRGVLTSSIEEGYGVDRREARQQFLGCLAVYEVSESCRRWCLEWTFIRGCSDDHDPDVEEEADNGEGDDDTSDRRVDRPHVSRQAAGEEKKGDLEHDWKTLDEQPKWPSLEAFEFALAIATALNRRSTSVPEVYVQPLFAQHRDKRSQQRHQ